MPIAPGTLALYLLENNFLDSSGNGYTAVEVGTVPFVTVPAPPFGTYSAAFGAPTDYLTTPAGLTGVFAGSSNWTLFGRIYISSSASTSNAFTIYDGTDYIGIQFGMTGDVRIFTSLGGFMLAASAPGVVGAGAWYDFAVTYDGTDMKGYAYLSGGTSSTPVVTLGPVSATVPATALVNMGILFVGAELPVQGFMDDLRIMTTTETSFPVTDPPAGGGVAKEAASRRMSS